MKKILVLIFVIAISSCVIHRTSPIDTNLRTYEKVIDLPEKSKEDIFVLSNKWMVETFNSAQSVIEYSDKEAGTIMGKYVFDYTGHFVKSIIQIDARENKCRIHFKNPLIRNVDRDLDYRDMRSNESMILTNNKWKELAESFSTYLQTNVEWN